MDERKFVVLKKEEYKIKEFVKKYLGKGKVSKVEIEYTPVGEKVIMRTSKPGLIIGRGGEKISKLTEVLKRRFKFENPHIEIQEIENMFDKDDENYLVRQIGNNQIVLFLGAGFSRDAKNRLGEDFPTSWGLGEKMWNFLSYVGDYDNTPLAQMYQAFLSAGIKKQQKTYTKKVFRDAAVSRFLKAMCPQKELFLLNS